MNSLFKTFLAAFALASAGVASAMTFSELQSAVDAAAPGDTVYVTSDMTFDGPLAVAKKVTIASAEGEETFVIRPDASYENGTFLSQSADSVDADVTFTNIIFDGQRGTTNRNLCELFLLKGGKVTLGAGAVIRNRYCPSYPAVQVSSKGEFVMEDGSEIRGIVSDNYGVAVKTGAAGNSSTDGTFRMNGGLITECAGRHKLTEEPANWDGAVYLYGGSVYAHGGTITGNTSVYNTAGVCVYYGKLYVSGSFTATNNVGGAANDVCRSREAGDSNIILIDGDYTGHMTVKLLGEKENPPTDGKPTRFLYTSEQGKPHLGCENIVSEDDPTLALDLSPSYIYGGWYPKWRRVIAKIAGKTNKFSYQEAFCAAESGDTVLLCTNVVFSARTVISNDVTVASAEGGPYAFTRGYKDIVLFETASNVTLTLKDIVIDGAGLSAEKSWGLLQVANGGTMILDSGTVVSNALTVNYAAAAQVTGNGSKLIMKDGALITGCRATGTNPYGSTVMIGNGADSNPTATFEMQGGTITGCSCDIAASTAVNSGYSGVVYVWKNNIFVMSGGAITNNSSANGCGGVVNYLGTIRLTGSAVIADNVGPYSDVFNCNAKRTYYYGDFRGRVGISNVGQIAGETTKVLREDASATGAWCFYPSMLEKGAYVGVQSASGDAVMWAEPIGSVGGVQAAATDDLQLLLPTAFDLNVGSADYAKLPVALTGAATALGANVALSFDVNMRKHKPAWTLPLIAAGADETLTGTWNFTLPEGSEKNWFANVTDSGCSLGYLPSGTLLFIR